MGNLQQVSVQGIRVHSNSLGQFHNMASWTLENNCFTSCDFAFFLLVTGFSVQCRPCSASGLDYFLLNAYTAWLYQKHPRLICRCILNAQVLGRPSVSSRCLPGHVCLGEV